MILSNIKIGPIALSWVVLAIATGFYARIAGWKWTAGMFVFAALCIVSASFLPSSLWIGVVVFVLAWIGQFYGHILEGKKPSFFKDLLFLLIGPIWVIKKFL